VLHPELERPERCDDGLDLHRHDLSRGSIGQSRKLDFQQACLFQVTFGFAISVLCRCTTASPTRSVLVRTVPAFCAPLIGSSSDSSTATLPNGASAAYRAVT
jgi:hypothetical protein